MDLAELGIVFISEGADAAIAKMEEFQAASAEVVQTDDQRVRAAGKVATATASLSDQITRSIIAYNGSKAATYEWQATLLGANKELAEQIELLKTLEQMEQLATQTAKELASEEQKAAAAAKKAAADMEKAERAKWDAIVATAERRAADVRMYTEQEAQRVAAAKKAEQDIADAKHKALYDAMGERQRMLNLYIQQEKERVAEEAKAAKQIVDTEAKAAKDAERIAEQKAISEIAWAHKSRDEQIRTKKQIAEYRAGGVGEATIASTFGPAAVNSMIKPVETLAHKWEEVSFANGRARTELVVIAHEMLQGRFSRVPASMMVLAENGSFLEVALSGVGMAIMGVVVAGAALSIYMVKGLLEQKAMADALIMTGNFAGTTAGAMDDMAHSIGKSNGSIAIAADVVTRLAASGRFTVDGMRVVATAVTGMAWAANLGEKEVDGLVKQFESLQVQSSANSRFTDNISKSLLQLDQQYHFLSTSVLANVLALEKEGNQKEASRVATEALADATKTRTQEMLDNLGLLEKAWNSVKKEIGDAKAAAMSFGKKDTVEMRIASATARIAELTKPSTTDNPGQGLLNDLIFNRAGKLKEAQDDLNQANREAIRINDRAVEQAAFAMAQTEGNIGLARLDAEATKSRTGNVELYITKVKALRSELTKVNESPTSTQDQKDKAANDFQVTLARYQQDLEGRKPTAARLSVADNIESDIAKFNQATIDITNNLDKQTAAQRFQSIELVKAQNAYKIGTLDAKGLAKAIMDIEDAVEKRNKAEALNDDQKMLLAWQKQMNKEADDAAAKNDRLATAYEGLDAAAKDYVKTLQEQSELRISGIGQGTENRNDITALITIDNKYAKAKQEIEKQSAADGEYWSQKKLDLAKEKYEQEVDIYKKTRDAMKEADRSFVVGSLEAYSNYMTDVANVGKHAEALTTKLLKGMEDNLVSFVQHGKLDFASLRDSIIADLIRIQIQSTMTGPFALFMKTLMSPTKGAGIGGSPIDSAFAPVPSANGNVFGTRAFADGGTFTNSIVSSPTAFRFAEGGSFRNGIMGEAGPEAVMPLSRGSDGSLGVRVNGGGAGQTVNITINATVGSVASKEDVVQGMKIVANQIAAKQARSMAYGG
jgi:lambda family phage tail tape measure protein